MHSKNDGINVVQISDTHIFSDEKKELLGFCTLSRLEKVIDHILSASPTPDIVLITGDISQDETRQSYELALNRFERFDCPVYWIAGNHDNPSALNPIFRNSDKLIKLETLITQYWDFVSIDSCKRGTDDGYISTAEYKKFQSKIKKSQSDNKNIVVVMHHHPLPVNTPLLDDCMLKNGSEFLEFVNSTQQIKLIMCGHVHGEYQIKQNGLVIETCPATCFQWVKGTSTVKTENTQGYKMFEFKSDSYSSKSIFI